MTPRIIACIACSIATAAFAADNTGYLRAEIERRQIPGLAYAVVDAGRIVEQGALGVANLELGTPATDETVFPIASLDKQLTAAGVMKLVERGRLDLEGDAAGPLGLDIPGLRVRHLLSHTSGLPDEVAPLVLGRELESYETADLLRHVRALVLLAPPGARYHYSDANFFLAQVLTEQAAGEPWRAFIERELFAPMGVRVWFLDPDRIVSGRAAGYRLAGDGSPRRDGRVEVNYGPLYNDLGMRVADFARWLIGLGADRPLSRPTLERMWAPTRLADGGPAREAFQWPHYGFGVGLDRIAGERVVLHSGSSGVGFVYLPDRRFGVVVFTNLQHSAGSDPIGLALTIAARFHPQLDLAARPISRSSDPESTATARELYDSFLAGLPKLDLVAAREQTVVAEGAPGLAGRRRAFGPLLRFEALGADLPVDGLSLQVFLATHERAHVVLRLGFDAAGKVETVIWGHV